ncbi:MAG: hypothetical protein RL538_433 [Candidatus Parcubacteria bacterium]|jgi:regulator of sigma E protease
MSVFLFLLVLFVLVLVHEWGHYITAKKTGMKVDEFAIGFPPRLFGIKRGETDFNFNLLPIGGYVKIFGENAEEAAEMGAAPRDPKDVGRAFGERPKWAQAVVLLAGITMNILFAWFLFVVVLMIGVPTAVDEASATQDAQLVVAGTLPDSPAAAALPTGAIIERATSGGDVLEAPTPSTFSAFVSSHAPEPIEVTFVNNDETKEVVIVPKNGLVEGEPEKYVIGTSLSLVEMRREAPLMAVKDGLVMTVDGLTAITTGLYTLIRDSFVGQADLKSVAGPVGIVGMVGDAASYGLSPLLLFTAMISLNLAVINLLPFPALDGGRLVFVAIEAVTKRQVPPRVTGWVNLFGFVLLMILMAAVTFNDITRLL